MIDRHPKPQDWLLLLILALIWGSSFILMKEGLKAFRPDQVATLRIVFTGLVLSPFAWIKRSEMSRNKVSTILVQSMFGNFIPAFLFPAAQSRINSSTAGILNSLSPVWVLLLGMFFFGARFKLIRLAGILIAFGGALLLVVYQPTHGSNVNATYGLLIVLATFCYGLSANMLKRHLHDTSPIIISAVAFGIMLVPAAIYLFSTGFIPMLRSHPQAWSSMGAIAVLAIFGTAIASVIFNRLVHRTSALYGASVTYLMPVIALWWGFMDGEAIHAVDFTGMALIILGVYLISR